MRLKQPGCDPVGSSHHSFSDVSARRRRRRAGRQVRDHGPDERPHPRARTATTLAARRRPRGPGSQGRRRVRKPRTRRCERAPTTPPPVFAASKRRPAGEQCARGGGRAPGGASERHHCREAGRRTRASPRSPAAARPAYEPEARSARAESSAAAKRTSAGARALMSCSRRERPAASRCVMMRRWPSARYQRDHARLGTRRARPGRRFTLCASSPESSSSPPRDRSLEPTGARAIARHDMGSQLPSPTPRLAGSPVAFLKDLLEFNRGRSFRGLGIPARRPPPFPTSNMTWPGGHGNPLVHKLRRIGNSLGTEAVAAGAPIQQLPSMSLATGKVRMVQRDASRAPVTELSPDTSRASSMRGGRTVEVERVDLGALVARENTAAS